MEGRELPQDLPDHLFVSSSNHPGFSQAQDLDWVGDFFRHLPSNGGDGCDAGPAGEGSVTAGKEKRRKVVGGGGGCKAMKAAKPRFAFRTKSSEDVLDDGFRWRKYGQKAVKNSVHPSISFFLGAWDAADVDGESRSYYRCVHHTCSVKKQVQRLSEDTSTVVTTYEGVHNHPCQQMMEALAPLLRQIHFLSKF
ncbi:hypothetical protein SAY86_010815 [Trapa natans]|uniref:WRKY domain-containing protein n=1 Tax=Trapa natans TaxID=22666 RepID=A0AAN7LW04_TRANT|nr:hypothetical protein SAY86_010815 [Trapa natans]